MGNNTNKQILSEVKSTNKYLKKEIPIIIETLSDHRQKINSAESSINNIQNQVLQLDNKLSSVTDSLAQYAYHYNTRVCPVLERFESPNPTQTYFLEKSVHSNIE